MKLGILVESEEGLDWDRWRATYRRAEQLGFDSLWLSDHLASAWSPDRHGLDPWLALSVAMAETARIRLGTLVSPITFRQPALLARMAEALDDLGHGRLVLGLGLGWNADEHTRFGIPFPGVGERARLLGEAIDCLRRMQPERHVPLLIGGGGRRWSLPLVARYADEWNMTTASLVVYQERSQQLAELCLAIGRDPGTIRRSLAVGFVVGRDTAELRQRGLRLAGCVPPLAQADDPLQAARDMGWLVGTSGQVADELRGLGRAGVDLAILGHYDLSDVDVLDLLAADVVPLLA